MTQAVSIDPRSTPVEKEERTALYLNAIEASQSRVQGGLLILLDVALDVRKRHFDRMRVAAETDERRGDRFDVRKQWGATIGVVGAADSVEL